jgi:phage terminase large subunit GpA-like protein
VSSVFDHPDALDLVLRTGGKFAPPDRLCASAWAEANLYLPASANARPGPLRLAKYQADMVDAIDHPDVRVAVLNLASQVGKSLAVDALVTCRMAQEPGPFLCVYPTDAKGKTWVQDRLNPLIAESPTLRALIGGGGKGKGGHSYRRKAFPGGTLNVGSSHKPEDLAQRAVSLVLLDEVDRFAASVGQEGDPVLLAIKRLLTYGPTSKAVLSSTPTHAGSRIHAWHLRGDQREWFVPCPECGDCQLLSFARLKWTPNKPQSAYLLCESCDHHISERERMAAVELGDWIPQAEGEPGIISFHASELISTFSNMGNVVAQAEEGAKSEEARRVFLNTSLAETYRVDGVALEIDEIASKAVPLAPPYPADIQFVAAGVDVQQNRVEVSFLGTAKAGVQYVLDHVVVPGDTSGGAVWEALDAVLGRVFPLADRRVLPVVVTAIDAGYQQQAVVDFVMARRARGLAIYPVLGRDGFHRPTTKQGEKLREIVRSTIVGTDQVKLDVLNRLNMPRPEGRPSPGALVLPSHLPPEYFEQLAFERLETVFVRGAPRRKWVPKAAKTSGGGQNEGLDCLVYVVAISKRVNVADPKAPAQPTSREIGAAFNKLRQPEAEQPSEGRYNGS